MDKNLDKILLKDEKVLWSGVSAPFPLLDRWKANGPKILIQWIATAVITTALLWAYLVNNQPGSPVFVGGVLAAAVLVILSPVLEWKNVQAQRYVITDRRVLLLQRFNTVFSIRLDHIDDFRLVADESPYPCLVIGTALYGDIGKQLRWRSCHPKSNLSSSEMDNLEGLVLYNLKDADQTAALLNRLMTSDAA